MNKVLEVQFAGWTATPRMPFVISGGPKGGSVCMPTPSYSLLFGLIGCCLGRLVNISEVSFGFKYSFDSVAKDLERRNRLENKSGKIKDHPDGSNPYLMEFHTAPKLTLWLNRLDWECYFLNPIGTPSLGRSQDILKIENVRTIDVKLVEEAIISGCMLPFTSDIKVGGQLVQLAEAFKESEEIGGGRIATKTGVFIAISQDNEQLIKIENLYQNQGEGGESFYLHQFS